ncbi:MAG: hypothetical protein U9R79_03635 [Armatimonadota bacterium]|nr:hypothetical protein [Armatimonadota bacterium]
METHGSGGKEQGELEAQQSRELRRLWLRAWLFSALGSVAGAALFFGATFVLWRWQGWDPAAGRAELEIGLFLRMIVGGVLGAALGSLLGVREPAELSLATAAGGCLTYLLGMQVVIVALYGLCPGIWRGETVTGLGRLEVLLAAGAVGALAPPLVATYVVRRYDRAGRREEGPDSASDDEEP